MTRLRRLAVALGLAAVLTVGSAAAAIANPPPPTNGGNGGGSSGQCTGNPDSRPASCGP
jgi:Spy/CpxP family protein refolding chaperone